MGGFIVILVLRGIYINLVFLDYVDKILMNVTCTAMDHVIDDNVEAAEAELETGGSVWHKVSPL